MQKKVIHWLLVVALLVVSGALAAMNAMNMATLFMPAEMGNIGTMATVVSAVTAFGTVFAGWAVLSFVMVLIVPAITKSTLDEMPLNKKSDFFILVGYASLVSIAVALIVNTRIPQLAAIISAEGFEMTELQGLKEMKFISIIQGVGSLVQYAYLTFIFTLKQKLNAKQAALLGGFFAIIFLVLKVAIPLLSNSAANAAASMAG
ncbi:MAG: hypothetical protein JXR53_10070 [Bacteroidales bacterium]|nr:hypothetical protein [Bacteroidales bacterium]